MDFAHYDSFLSVPDHLANYMSAGLLSTDYWNNILTVEEFEKMQQQAEQHYNILPLTVAPFRFELKIEDLGQGFPRVPRYHSRQGFIFLWSIDTECSNVGLPDKVLNFAADGLQFKSENQHIKSSCSSFIEFCAAQVYIESEYMFVGILKTPGWFKKCGTVLANTYYKLFWKDIAAYADSIGKPVIVPTVSYMNQVQQQLNQRTVSHGPYHYKIMHRAGFKRQVLGSTFELIRIPSTQEVWYHGN